MKLHQLRNVELGLFQNLDFPDETILQREDTLGLLLNLLANGLWDQLLHELAELNFACFLGHDLDHLPSDLSDLSRLCIAVRLHLFRPALCEGYAEHSYNIVVQSLDVHVCFDQSLPFLDERANLVAGQVHAMEIRQAAPALDFFYA